MSRDAMQPLRPPAEFWQRGDVITALEARDIGALFRLLRQHAGASQTRIGANVGMPQGEVSLIMSTGPRQRRVIAHDVFTRIADGLHMPDHARRHLGLAHQDTAPAGHDHDESTTRPGTNAQRQPRTMLEYLIRQRDATYEELAEQFSKLDERATISARHLGRLARGERGAAGTNPATRRALQAMFSLPAAELLRPWSAASAPATTTDFLSAVDLLSSTVDTNLPEAVDENTPGAFGTALRALRTAAGLSLTALAQHAKYSKQIIGHVETGHRTPTREIAAALDHALGARGHLIELAALQRSGQTITRQAAQLSREAGHTMVIERHSASTSPQTDSPVDPPHGEDPHVNRRRFIQGVASMALATSMAGVEQIRHDLVAALGHDENPDIWPETVAEYGQSFYLTPPDVLLRDLMADTLLVKQQLSTAPDQTRPQLRRTAGQLAAITAMTCASLGQRRQALRWWETARGASDKSEDTATRVWVRAWEVSNGLYENRPIRTIVDRAQEARAIAGNRPDAGTAGLLAGLSQTLAVAGHPDAVATLREVASLTARMPSKVANDRSSMFGWPEVRLRHTESYVYTTLGDTVRAYAAQDAALALYGSDLLRERAAMLLHRSRCMIKDGEVVDGIAYAHDVLDHLPAEHHTELVYSIARDVADAVPGSETQRPAVGGLRDRLALPSRLS